jgi:DUF1680 family protein
VTVRRTPQKCWALSLRIPAWCPAWTLRVNGAPVAGAASRDGWLRVLRAWQAGDTLTLDLDLRPRITRPHPRADAVRGCVALEYGPLVYCLEQTDQPAGTDLDAIALDTAAPVHARPAPELLGGITVLTATALALPGATAGHWPPGPGKERPEASEPVTVTAVPYGLWANREPGAMRVWVPETQVPETQAPETQG